MQGLKETGYAERQNVMIEYRWADGQYARFPEMVRDLIHRQVTVIAVNTPAARITKQAATNIPIVFFTGEDPVTSGLCDGCDLDVWRTSGQAIWPIA